MVLFVPGLIAALLVRASWLAAIALAPGVSTTALVLISVGSSEAGVPWGPLPLIAGLLAVWLGAAALGVLLRRYCAAEEPSHVPLAALAVTGMAALAVALVLLPVSQTPESFPQHPDTIFHLGAAQWMVEHHDASFLHALDFSSPSAGGIYPAAFHTMVATTAQLSGAPVVVAASSFVLVIAGVAWPLGCIFLARALFGSHLAVTLSAGVVSIAFSAYPFMLMGYGVLWPTFFGGALLPGALALLAVLISAVHQESPPLTSKVRAAVLLLATLPGLAIAHVNAIVTFLLFGAVMVAGVVLGKAWQMRRQHPRLAAASAAGLVVATGLAFLASTANGSKGGRMLKFGKAGPELPRREAVYDVLLFARHGAGPLWVLAALVAAGTVIVLLRCRGRRWLVAALIITAVLLYLNVGVDSPTVRLLTWPWNNQSVRLGAIGVLPAVLLAAVALATGARFLESRLALQTRIRLPSWTPAVVVPLLFAVVTGGAYVDTHRRTLDPYFHPDDARSWASKAELRALHNLARHVPKNAVVAENPWKGGSYMYVVSGRHMLFPTEKTRTPGDRALLASRLDEVGTSTTVCEAARRQHVRFAITGGRPVAGAVLRSKQYAGIDAVGSSNAFRKVAREGPYTLYQMVSCAKG